LAAQRDLGAKTVAQTKRRKSAAVGIFEYNRGKENWSKSYCQNCNLPKLPRTGDGEEKRFL
jgi:hypothetical protein